MRGSIAAAVRSTRFDRGWSQAELGRAAGMSRSMVSAVEAGVRTPSLEGLERIARALDMTLVLELRAPLVLGRADQRDAAHARCVIAVRRALERLGYECAVEVPIADGRIRGWVDLLAWDRASGRLLVVEVKTELRDLGGLHRQMDLYARAAAGAAASLGWPAREVRVLAIFLATAENDERLLAQRDGIAAAFPTRGRALDAALLGGPWKGWGISMVDPRRRGTRAWLGLALDGRRRPAPYASYADFMRTERGRIRHVSRAAARRQ